MSGHVLPLRVYWFTFGALMVLTALTTAVAFVDMGAWNDVVAMSIAFAKALVVVLYFMHVRYSNRLIALAVGAGLFWLLILFVLALGDYRTRGLIPGWG